MATFGVSENKAEKAGRQRKRRIDPSQKERMRQETPRGQRGRKRRILLAPSGICLMVSVRNANAILYLSSMIHPCILPKKLLLLQILNKIYCLWQNHLQAKNKCLSNYIFPPHCRAHGKGIRGNKRGGKRKIPRITWSEISWEQEPIEFIIQSGTPLEVKWSAFSNYVRTQALNQDCPLSLRMYGHLSNEGILDSFSQDDRQR